MHELSFNILCLVGAIYLFYRITILLKTLWQGFFKPGKAVDNSTKDNISELYHSNLTAFGDSE
jgi:hypothetical protein